MKHQNSGIKQMKEADSQVQIWKLKFQAFFSCNSDSLRLQVSAICNLQCPFFNSLLTIWHFICKSNLSCTASVLDTVVDHRI